MQAFDSVKSRTAVLPYDDIDTDQIIPARFLTTTSREGLGRGAFADWRYAPDGGLRADFPLNQPAASGCHILVAGHNFGCGSSREHAAWALLDYGFRAVISTKIADIFWSNALKNGLLPVKVDEATYQWLVDHPQAEVQIDLREQQLRLTADHAVAFSIDPFSRYCLLNGIDQLGFLQQHLADIERFEKARAWQP